MVESSGDDASMPPQLTVAAASGTDALCCLSSCSPSPNIMDSVWSGRGEEKNKEDSNENED